MHRYAVVFLASVLFTAALGAQSTDPANPTVLSTTVLDGTVDGNGGTWYFRFNAGPGDLTINVEATTDYYSHPLDIDLTRGGVRVGDLEVIGTDSGGTASHTFSLAKAQTLGLRLRAGKDDHVKWLKYHIQLGGAAIELLTEVASVAPDAGVATAVVAAPVATPVATPVVDSASATTTAAADPSALVALTQLLETTTLPAAGSLRIEMKDGSVRMIDLARIAHLSVVAK